MLSDNGNEFRGPPFSDALARLGVRHSSTYPPGKSNWLEAGIVERLRDELNIPITQVVVRPDRVPQTAGQ